MIFGKMRSFFCICFLLAALITLPAFLPAQTADEIEFLLDTEALSYEEAARFVLEAADSAAFSNPADAFRYAAEQNWLPRKAVPDAQARLDVVSLLIMRSFDIKGGLFYSIAKNPHYAYREMVYQGVIQGRAAPGMAVSGDTLLFMVGRVLSLREDTTQEAEKPEHKALQAEDQETLVAQINAALAANNIFDVRARLAKQGATISFSNIRFPVNSAELPESEKQKLREVAEIIRSIPNQKILTIGHTAITGTIDDQVWLSQDRAAAIAAYMISQGIGSDRQAADNNTSQGTTLNRRVEINIQEDK